MHGEQFLSSSRSIYGHIPNLTLHSPGQFKLTLPEQGSWSRRSQEVPFNFTYSVLLRILLLSVEIKIQTSRHYPSGKGLVQDIALCFSGMERSDWSLHYFSFSDTHDKFCQTDLSLFIHRHLILESAPVQDIVIVCEQKLSSKKQPSSPCPLCAARDSAVTAMTFHLTKLTEHMTQITTMLRAEKTRATGGQRKDSQSLFLSAREILDSWLSHKCQFAVCLQ